ncbi:MAG: type II toxin-antitoxin system PemK/MazF family toxin, partial [Pseudolabrys sp.]
MFRKKSIGVRTGAMRHGDVAAPDAGDIIWLDFLTTGYNEQAGRRPALVLSPRIFNELTGRC